MIKLLSALGRTLEHPSVGLTLGLVLVGMGVFDLAETVLEETIGFEIGAHHGVILLGIVHGLKALTELTVGSLRIRGAIK